MWIINLVGSLQKVTNKLIFYRRHFFELSAPSFHIIITCVTVKYPNSNLLSASVFIFIIVLYSLEDDSMVQTGFDMKMEHSRIVYSCLFFAKDTPLTVNLLNLNLSLQLTLHLSLNLNRSLSLKIKLKKNMQENSKPMTFF